MAFKSAEEKRAYQKAYYLSNRDKLISRQREYYEANKQKRNSYNREYFAARRSELNARRRENHQANKEERNAKNRAYQRANRKRLYEQQKVYRAANKDRAHTWQLRHRYGITLEDKTALLNTQHGKCPICHRDIYGETALIDHDHTTGKIRGLLCRRCNLALGYVDDNIDVLRTAIEYLEAHNGCR